MENSSPKCQAFREKWLKEFYSICPIHCLWNRQTKQSPLRTWHQNIIWKIDIFVYICWNILQSAVFAHRSKRDIFLSPTYFKPCSVVFIKYWSQFSRQESYRERIWSFLNRISCVSFIPRLLNGASVCNFAPNIIIKSTNVLLQSEVFSQYNKLIYCAHTYIYCPFWWHKTCQKLWAYLSTEADKFKLLF